VRRPEAKRNSLLKYVSEFNLDVAPTIQPAQLATPGSDGSLQAGEPLVLLGNSGTGKMHLLIGSGLACGQCRKVRYATFAQLVRPTLSKPPTNVSCLVC
jgi:DNA replication protein DnaC